MVGRTAGRRRLARREAIMSCAGNRARYFAAAASEPAVLQAFGGDPERARQIIETIYDTACQRQDVPPPLADALTRVLFGQMKGLGITPPTHAADGLPKLAARQGYAALAQTLMAIRNGRPLPQLAAQIAQTIPSRAVSTPAEDAPAAVLEAYGSRWRRSGGSSATRSGPDSVSITIGGRTYYVSGADFTTMKDAVKDYARRMGVEPKRAWDFEAKTWRIPGTLADVEAALKPYRITEDKPAADDGIDRVLPGEEPAAAGDGATADVAAPDSADPDETDARPTHRMWPSDPPGAIPPEAMDILNDAMRGANIMTRAALLDFANGQPIGRSEAAAVNELLRGAAQKLRTRFGKKRTDVPLIYWARQFAASSAKRHAMAVAILSALGHPRCGSCGQWMPGAGSSRTHTCPSPAFGSDGYNGFGVDRYGVSRWGTTKDGMPLPRRRTVLEASKDYVIEADPINNAAMAELWGRVASGVAGHDCRVILREGGGFATDMQGTIYADPYPLGHDADPRHTMVVTKAGIYHEIGHELTTPPEDWAYLLEIAAGRETVPGIEKGRNIITKIYNIIEDGRMERDMSDRFPGVAETLAAQCAIYPRWHERVGPGVPLGDEVIWPLLYTALPYFSVRDEVRAAMTPEGRALFEDLEPIARRGALGTPEDSLAATIDITRRLEAAGMLDIPETSATPPPPPPPGTKPRSGPPASGEGSDSSSEADGKADKDAGEEAGGRGRAGAGAEEDGSTGERGGTGAGADEDESTDGRRRAGAVDPHAASKDSAPLGDNGTLPSRPAGGRADTDVRDRLTPERLEDILNDLEAQAVSATEREIARQGRYDTLGGLLHAPLTGNTSALWDEGYVKQTPPSDTTRQRYRTPDGQVVAVQTGTPKETDPHVLADLERRRPQQQEIAGRLARRLESIRQETITRLRMQPEGRFDRRRIPAAMAGREDVRTRITTTDDTGMAVSLLLDQSGSMHSQHITTGRLYDATRIIGQALEGIDVPYEVRGHGGASTQYKAMDESTLDPQRAARLTQDCTSSNFVTAPVVGLATAALRARPDANRLIVNLMDGDMEDQEAAVAQYQETRRQGIVTFGVFLGKPSFSQQERMTALFRTNNWRPIGDLTELPQVVGQRIADIFESLGGDQ